MDVTQLHALEVEEESFVMDVLEDQPSFPLTLTVQIPSAFLNDFTNIAHSITVGPVMSTTLSGFIPVQTADVTIPPIPKIGTFNMNWLYRDK
nr:hypothetical protein BaRGS_006286 [Batillaria attramentaria]